MANGRVATQACECRLWAVACVASGSGPVTRAIRGGLTAGLRRTRRCAKKIDSLYLFYLALYKFLSPGNIWFYLLTYLLTYSGINSSNAYADKDQTSVEVASVESPGSATNNTHVLPPDVPRLQLRTTVHK